MVLFQIMSITDLHSYILCFKEKYLFKISVDLAFGCAWGGLIFTITYKFLQK